MKQAIFFAGIAAMILASCAKERAEQDSTQTEQAFRGTVVTIQAAIGGQESAGPDSPLQNAATRTTQSGGTFSWSGDEKISVGTDDGYTTFDLDDAETGTFSHTFAGDVVPELQMAISPVQSGSYAGTDDFQVSLPTVYNGYVSGTTNALMIGTPDPKTEKKFLFHHAAALIKVTYNNVPYRTTGLVLEAKQNIASTSGITLGSTDDVIASDNAALNSSSVRLNLASAVSAANQSLVFYVPVPVGEYTGLKIYLLDSSGNKIDRSEKTSTKAFTLARKEIFATPGITVDIPIDPVTVGTDNTTEGLGANKSQKFKINQGKRLNLIFENFSAATLQPYYNWVVYNDQNNLYVRADKYAKDNTISWGQTSVGNFPASTTYNAADLNETTVIMTIDYYESGAYILNAVAKKNSTTYDLQFQYTYSTKPEEINIQLYTDHSHYVMKDAWIEDAPVIKEVVGIEATANAIVYGEAEYATFSEEALIVNKVYSDNSKERIVSGYTATKIAIAPLYDMNKPIISVADKKSVTAPYTVTYGTYSNINCTVNITHETQTQTAVLGEGDHYSGWYSSETGYYNISTNWNVPAGSSVTIGMTLSYKQGQELRAHYSPSTILRKADGSEYCVVRMDDYGWGDSYSAATSTHDWWFNNANNILSGATVYLTVTNNGNNKASVRYTIISNNNLNYNYRYLDNITVDSSDVSFAIATESTYITFM